MVSGLLRGEHTDEESECAAELRSGLLLGLLRGFRGLDFTKGEVENAQHVKLFLYTVIIVSRSHLTLLITSVITCIEQATIILIHQPTMNATS